METTMDNVIQRMENDLLCPICQDYFKQAITLNCTHSFCYNCISNWRKTRNECPICRLHIAGLTASLALDNLVSAYTNQEKVKTQIIVEDNISRSDGWNSNGEMSYNNGNRNPMDTEDFEGEFDVEEEEESDIDVSETEYDLDGDMDEESNLDITENSDLESANLSSEVEEEEDIFNSFETISDSNSSKSSSGNSTNSGSLQIHLSYNYDDGDVEEEEDGHEYLDDEDEDDDDVYVVSDDSI